MRRQKGVTLTGLMAWGVILFFAALLGFKIVPPYVEYYTIQKQLRIVADDPEVATGQRRAVENAFARRATIENIQAVAPQDLHIVKEGDRIIITADYSVLVPLVGNLSACIDFRASSAK
jgi:hypothetical protein